MIAAFSSFDEKNADICSSPEAKSSIIICASTYINAQTKLALLAADEGFWDNGIFENYDQNNYSENAKTAILQLNQAKIDFLQSMTTTVVSRKNEVIDMITFI
ncbi:MAG: hypothetical protein RR048_07785 [Oscillospiraceae bacterium]